MSSIGFPQPHHWPAHLSPAVEHLCACQGLAPYLSIALDLVRRFFRCEQEPVLQTEEDPETGEQWIAIQIAVRDTSAEFLDRYEQYTDEFVAQIPWPQRDKIRLSYSLT